LNNFAYSVTEETLRYFSRIYGMSAARFRERMEFLVKFLDLPPSGSRPLERMSGGQQRRASLALALLHQPDLLILDEPTVGVDPLLRYSTPPMEIYPSRTINGYVVNVLQYCPL
jgi:ABC-type multidrug transport system ATPase subunit